MSSGERPIGAAKGKQSDTKALCQTPRTTTTKPPHPKPPSPSLQTPHSGALAQGGTGMGVAKAFRR